MVNDEEEDPDDPDFIQKKVRRIMLEDLARDEEPSIFEPSPPFHVLWEETFGEVRRFSDKPKLHPDFPYRAMSEAEVRNFARGVALMITNAQLAEEDAHSRHDPEMDCFYRGQADRLHAVLRLLKKVLRKEWPHGDA